MSEHDSSTRVILLVDDDPGDQELTRRALASDSVNAELRIVNNGEEAMDYLLRRGAYTDPKSAPWPDLMLLDLNMPRMDGREVLKAVREHKTLRRIPIVVLTTSKQEQDILRSYDLGCNSFIAKPVHMNEFVETIRQLGLYWFTITALPTR